MTQSIRDQIRSATVGSKPEFKKVETTHEGFDVENRQPSYKDRKELMKKCQDKEGNLDTLDFLVWSVIQNTFVAGTDERVFESGDYEKLIAFPAGGFIDVIGQEALNLLNVEGKPTESSSETTS